LNPTAITTLVALHGTAGSLLDLLAAPARTGPDADLLATMVFLPLLAGFALLFVPNKLRALAKALALVVSLVTFYWAVQIFRNTPVAPYVWDLAGTFAVDLELALKADPLSSFILLFAAGFGVLITLYSLKSMAGSSRQTEYYAAVLLTIGGSVGILLADHLIFLLIFWEIVTASLYLLITTGGRNTNFAATKSFAMIGASDAAFLLGIAVTWVLTKTFRISQIHIATTSALPILAFLLLMLAAITKAGALPLHTWLPTSGQYAPVSVMALLPAALDKLLGIYLLVRIVKDLFILQSAALATVLALIGSATIVIAVMIAMVQHDLKRLLSYHAVSQVGYMILGIATLTPVGIAGGIFHMLNNAIYKCCLFLCGGAVEQQTATADLERLGGLARKMSITFATCLIAALSISGVPPFNGFVSKWMVYQGVIQMGSAKQFAAANLWPLYLTCAMFGSALTLASFVKVLHSVFLSRLPDEFKDKNIKEVPLVQTLPMIVLAVLCVLFGLFYHLPLKHFINPALGAESYTLSLWRSSLATVLILVGIIVGLLVWFLARLSAKIRIVSTWTCGEVMPNDQMIVPGTHFYKTVSSLRGLNALYSGQEKGYFDPYDQLGRIGLTFSNLLRWLHSGVLPTYLTWVTLGLLVILYIVCGIW